MKYKVVANGVVMIENASAIKALNAICSSMIGIGADYDVRVYYWSMPTKNWKLENRFSSESQEESAVRIWQGKA